MTCDRRGFLKALAAVPLAAMLPAPTPKIALHPDAFKVVTAPFDGFRYEVVYKWAIVNQKYAAVIYAD